MNININFETLKVVTAAVYIVIMFAFCAYHYITQNKKYKW